MYQHPMFGVGQHMLKPDPPIGARGSNCHGCGICCIVPDISTLKKAMWVPCVHLGNDRKCRIYDIRPAVCRNYVPDSVCDTLASIPDEVARIRHYAEAFELGEPPDQRAAP